MKEQFDKMGIIKIDNPLYIDREVEELLTAPNPYHLLKCKETLIEQHDRLNGLHPDDIQHLVFRIVANCPPADLVLYSLIISKFMHPPQEVNSEETSSSNSALETPFFNALHTALKTKRKEETTENDIDTCYSYNHLKHANRLFNQSDLRKRKLELEYIAVDLAGDGLMNIEPEAIDDEKDNNWCGLF